MLRGVGQGRADWFGDSQFALCSGNQSWMDLFSTHVLVLLGGIVLELHIVQFGVRAVFGQ